MDGAGGGVAGREAINLSPLPPPLKGRGGRLGKIPLSVSSGASAIDTGGMGCARYQWYQDDDRVVIVMYQAEDSDTVWELHRGRLGSG